MIIRSEFVVPVNVITDFTHVFQIGFTFFMKNLDEGVHFFLHHTGSIGKTGVIRRHIGLYQHAVIQFKLRIETDDTGRR